MIRIDRRTFVGALTALSWPLHAWARASRKEVLAFYYGWYGTAQRSGQDIHWQSIDAAHETIANSLDYPQDGPYDSLDPLVIKRHVQQARDAGITGFIASWWGQKDRTDQQFPLLLAAAGGLKLAPYLENAATPEALAADIDYLLQTYGKHDAWLRLDGKPVIFVFDRVVQTIGLDGWKAARAQIKGNAVFVGPANNVVEISERRGAFDALHIYSMQFPLIESHTIEAFWRAAFYHAWITAQKGLKVTTATVMPGFDDHLLPGRTGKRPVVDRDNGHLFKKLWRAAIGAKPDWVLIVSFNEWHETSQIEPSVQFNDRELATVKTMAARFRAS